MNKCILDVNVIKIWIRQINNVVVAACILVWACLSILIVSYCKKLPVCIFCRIKQNIIRLNLVVAFWVIQIFNLRFTVNIIIRAVYYLKTLFTWSRKSNKLVKVLWRLLEFIIHTSNIVINFKNFHLIEYWISE